MAAFRWDGAAAERQLPELVKQQRAEQPGALWPEYALGQIGQQDWPPAREDVGQAEAGRHLAEDAAQRRPGRQDTDLVQHAGHRLGAGLITEALECRPDGGDAERIVERADHPAPEAIV